MGLVGVPLAILDEPAALHTIGGTALWDAVRTAQGKPGSPLKAILTGTLAPSDPGSWWPVLVENGTAGSTWVGLLQGRADRWSHWREILRVNPLARDFPETAEVLREERDAAMADSRLAGAFKSFRLNLPAGDESTMLLAVDDWERSTARPVPDREGRPIVGIDLGAGRAWSAATAIWRSGRVEALAVAPGIPSLEAQERRDRQPWGTYRRLALRGALRVADGLRVQPPAELWRAVVAAWGKPARVVCDRFRLPELVDAIGPGVEIVPRVSRWSESSEDIRALRSMTADGPLAVEKDSRALLTASLGVAMGRGGRCRQRPNEKARDEQPGARRRGRGARARRRFVDALAASGAAAAALCDCRVTGFCCGIFVDKSQVARGVLNKGYRPIFAQGSPWEAAIMDGDLHVRIESLENLCREVLQAVRGLRVELSDFRKVQENQNVKVLAALSQFGIRVGTVESRMTAVEERVATVESLVTGA